jgi:hypothetical protein
MRLVDVIQYTSRLVRPYTYECAKWIPWYVVRVFDGESERDGDRLKAPSRDARRPNRSVTSVGQRGTLTTCRVAFSL